MARKPQITRTITTTKANVLCINITEAKPFEQEVIVPRTYKDEKALLKAVEAVVNNEDTKAVHIKSPEIVETMYGMSEQDFIAHAKVLDPATRKAIEAEEKENNE